MSTAEAITKRNTIWEGEKAAGEGERTNPETGQTMARWFGLSFIGRARVKCTQTREERWGGEAIACS